MLQKNSISQIDFEDLYKKQKELSSFLPKNAKDWDKKADSMVERFKNGSYNKEFLQKLNFTDIKTVLDVGCGVGNLSIPIAKRVESVRSLDFSARMLEHLDEYQKDENLQNIKKYNLSWYDDWNLDLKSDMVIASRSMEVRDMRYALEKLNDFAIKRVYLTYKTEGTFVDKEIIDLLDLEVHPKPDYIYIVNILYKMGIKAKVDFIPISEDSSFSSLDDFVSSVSWSLGELSEEAKQKLTIYYNNVVQNETVHKVAKSRSSWAFISWEKN